MSLFYLFSREIAKLCILFFCSCSVSRQFFFILPTTRLAVSFFLYKYLVRNNRRKYKPSLCFSSSGTRPPKSDSDSLSIYLSIPIIQPSIYPPYFVFWQKIYEKITHTHTLTSCKARVLLFRSFFLSFSSRATITTTTALSQFPIPLPLFPNQPVFSSSSLSVLFSALRKNSFVF